MITLDEIFKPVKKELKLVEDEIKGIRLNDKNFYPLIDFLRKAKGKRIRPAIVLLASRFSRNGNGQSIVLAAQMELIHSASLIHDDIIDKASLRRGFITLNKKVGDGAALVFGDFLFSQVFNSLSKINNPEIIKIISALIQKICKGELEQLKSVSEYDISVNKYLESISNKTASFFEACCEIGGIVSGAKTGEINILKEYGLNLGMLFQLTDDYLDIAGNIDTEKKSLFTDIKTGKTTLPIIYLWQNLSMQKRNSLFPKKNGKVSDARVKKIVDAVKENGANKKTEKLIRLYADRAKKTISKLKNKEIAGNLSLLVDYQTGKINGKQ